jgi:hypothetical protein
MTPKVIAGKKVAEKERVSLYLPPNMAKKISIISAVDGVTQNQAIIDLLKDALEDVDMAGYVKDFANLDDEDDEDDEKEDDDEDEKEVGG